MKQNKKKHTRFSNQNPYLENVKMYFLRSTQMYPVFELFVCVCVCVWNLSPFGSLRGKDFSVARAWVDSSADWAPWSGRRWRECSLYAAALRGGENSRGMKFKAQKWEDSSPYGEFLNSVNAASKNCLPHQENFFQRNTAIFVLLALCNYTAVLAVIVWCFQV